MENRNLSLFLLCRIVIFHKCVFVQRRSVAPPPEERPIPTTPGASRTRRSSRRIEVPIEETKPVETADVEADNNADRDSNGSNETEAVSCLTNTY